MSGWWLCLTVLGYNSDTCRCIIVLARLCYIGKGFLCSSEGFPVHMPFQDNHMVKKNTQMFYAASRSSLNKSRTPVQSL